jgi:hypothetical protein
MSFIVKGIDLPKEYTRVIAITPNGEVWQVNPIGKNERLEAQAIQIPKEHGRLGDLDELNKSVHKWNPAFTYGRTAFTREIGNAPTILEAEE